MTRHSIQTLFIKAPPPTPPTGLAPGEAEETAAQAKARFNKAQSFKKTAAGFSRGGTNAAGNPQAGSPVTGGIASAGVTVDASQNIAVITGGTSEERKSVLNEIHGTLKEINSKTIKAEESR